MNYIVHLFPETKKKNGKKFTKHILKRDKCSLHERSTLVELFPIKIAAPFMNLFVRGLSKRVGTTDDNYSLLIDVIPNEVTAVTNRDMSITEIYLTCFV